MFCGECGTESTDQASFCPACGHDLTLQRAQSTQASVEVAIDEDLGRSGFWRRFAAHAIDVVIVWFAMDIIWTTFVGTLGFSGSGSIEGFGALTLRFFFTPLVSQAYMLGEWWSGFSYRYYAHGRWLYIGLDFLVLLGAIFAYYVVGTTVWGRTLGKAALGIRVVGPDGNPPGIVRTIIRETVGKFLSGIFWIGFLMAAGKQKRALHDRISGTKVEISPTNWRKRGNLNPRMHDDL